MKLLCVVVLLAVASAAIAAEPPVPQEFVGEWVPTSTSCQAPMRLRVFKDRVTLINKSDSQSFGSLDVCYSCEGGVRYTGGVVWLTPESGKGGLAPFIVRFHTIEQKGITVVEMLREDLKKRFPLHNIKLRKCGNMT